MFLQYSTVNSAVPKHTTTKTICKELFLHFNFVILAYPVPMWMSYLLCSALSFSDQAKPNPTERAASQRRQILLTDRFNSQLSEQQIVTQFLTLRLRLVSRFQSVEGSRPTIEMKEGMLECCVESTPCCVRVRIAHDSQEETMKNKEHFLMTFWRDGFQISRGAGWEPSFPWAARLLAALARLPAPSANVVPAAATAASPPGWCTPSSSSSPPSCAASCWPRGCRTAWPASPSAGVTSRHLTPSERMWTSLASSSVWAVWASVAALSR